MKTNLFVKSMLYQLYKFLFRVENDFIKTMYSNVILKSIQALVMNMNEIIFPVLKCVLNILKFWCPTLNFLWSFDALYDKQANQDKEKNP